MTTFDPYAAQDEIWKLEEEIKRLKAENASLKERIEAWESRDMIGEDN